MTSLRQTLTYQPVELSFGTSGLRGLVVDMTDLECYINTVGFLKFLKKQDRLEPRATIYLAGDLRDSTPKIMRAVQTACQDTGYQVTYLGLIPTPALALYALKFHAPGIMVTGSHIPADRNGIKFYKSAGEVLKEDESAIKNHVAAVRGLVYAQPAGETQFNPQGGLTKSVTLPAEEPAASADFLARFTTIFGQETLKGKKIVFYQHSAVGRDLIATILTRLGAQVVPVGRSDVFIPIDSENVTPDNKAYFRQLAAEHPDAFAIVSTDGDSDRPFVIDETGTFHLGDGLGAITATWLGTDFAAFTANAGDAVSTYLTDKGISFERTKLGSPYVVSLMEKGRQAGKKRPVGWEVNGGFLTGVDLTVKGHSLPALPTRDATLPILVALVAALEAGQTVSQLFAQLPINFPANGLINNFPTVIAKQILERFSRDTPETRAEITNYFSPALGFSEIATIDTLDGVRISFANGDLAHLRASGNAPQFRIYSFANTQERADAIVALAIREPDGLYRQMEQTLTTSPAEPQRR